MTSKPQERDEPEGSLRGVYAIFEGGGAKGITHIGAMKALEDENLALVGVAGSSAGAIIAALAALGYRADELFSPDGADDILKRFGKNPIDLIGKVSWKRLSRTRRWFVPTLILLAVALAAGIMALSWFPGWSLGAFVLAGLCALVILYFLWPVLVGRGMLSTGAMRDTLNEVLRAKLKLHYKEAGLRAPPALVRFEDIDPTKAPRCCRLKIVVSDARSGQMVMFDHNTPNVVVADAVAASASIPIVFRSPAVRGAREDGSPVYVDGGLVSNLPAWSFRTEKRALERRQNSVRVPIFAFTLADETGGGAGEKRNGLVGFIVDVLRTGIFGSQKIVEEFVPDLEVIELASPLGTLAFDCTREDARAAYEAGVQAASARLKRRRLADAGTAHALETILDAMRRKIRAKRRGRPMPRLRMSLVDPVDERGSAFRVVASADMAQDADDRLEFDLDNDVAPRAYKDSMSIYSEISGRTAAALRMTKYERALLAPDLSSIICVPVYATAVTGRLANRPRPQRILCLDSSDSLQKEFNDPKFMKALATASAKTSRTLIEDLVEERLK